MADTIYSIHVITANEDTSALATVEGKSGSLDGYEDAYIFTALASDLLSELPGSGRLREVSLDSRDGWLNAIVQKLAETSGIAGLEALYGGAGPAYLLVDDSWWRWTAVFSHGEDLLRIARAIDALFAWSAAHIDQAAQLTFDDKAEVVKAIANPIASSGANGYDTDSACAAVVFSYLHSVREVMRTAAENNLFVFSLIQN